jgi:hypothetical protein
MMKSQESPAVGTVIVLSFVFRIYLLGIASLILFIPQVYNFKPQQLVDC